MSEQPIAEVIESSTTGFAAQCYELHHSPPFGAFIKVKAPVTIIAMVYEISTGSTEPNRRPIAYGKTEAQLREEQPQIFELLRTELSAKIVGYADERGWRQLLPPHPPKLHSFVSPCTPDEVQAFTRSCVYFRTLIGIGGTLADELLIAAIQQTCQVHGDAGRSFLVQAGKELARLFRDEYDRMESILRRITL